MGFLQPLALLALGAAAIPALLHLLQRREPPTVPFPAVRYLAEAERRHSRRLKLRHLLLLALRTALVLAVVLAAARPVVPVPAGGIHAPTSLVLIVDNSLSSGAVADGRRVLDRLADEARTVLREAGPSDRLWLLTAEGVPVRVEAGEAAGAVAALKPMPVRLDLTDAVRAAADVLEGLRLPGEIVVVSDLQASALSGGPATERRVVALAGGPVPANRGVARARPDPSLWSPGGRVIADIGGGEAGAGEVALLLGNRAVARDLAAPGEAVALPVASLPVGWHRAQVALSPDELRLDDTAYLALRSTPAAAVAAGSGAGRFVEQALAVLAAGGRVRPGTEVTIGDRPGPGRTILVPPADPARVGAVNRALAARGSALRLGEPVSGEWPLAGELPEVAGGSVTRRYRVTGAGAVLATAGGEPWLVKAGDVLVAASRLEPEWTSLPLTAGFVPLLDALVNRVAAAEVWRVAARPGEVVTLPPAAATALLPRGRAAVGGDRRLTAPPAPGAYFLLGAGGDTVGALEVNADPRESDLAPADADAARAALGPATEVRPRLAGRVFAAGHRAEISSPLLALAVALAVAEFLLAGAGGGRRTDAA
ncbi:MAG TPA: BatA domain-containing protein [Gemmatimonadales bacterium]|nr:BatA domain-containing protein [Gemmatimonadales bacterium]